MTRPDEGWAWFAGPDGSGGDHEPDRALLTACARCFSTPDGERVLRHLNFLTRERVLGPGAPDAVLRHVEGQRHLVAHLTALIERGKTQGEAR